MSDPFHPAVKDEWLDQMMAAIALNPHLTFQLLTKRPERMLEYFKSYDTSRNIEKKANEITTAKNLRTTDADGIKLIKFPYECMDWPLPNLWPGVTVENQAAADDRIPLLLQTPAAVRFLSVEPMLGAIDLLNVEWPNLGGHKVDVLRGGYWDKRMGFVNHCDMPGFDDGLISWVIIGGESGSNARPFNLEWAEFIINQCKEAGIPPFMKQVGSNAYYGGDRFKTKSRAGAAPSEWPEHLRVQEFPEKE